MRKILVIEDDSVIRNRIVDTLELDAEGFTIFTADNGRTGVEIAEREIPDVIISDIMMPGVDGNEVLETLRQNPTTALIPFIFLSAKADRDHVREGMLSGADDYLTKPFSIDELLRTVHTQLNKYEIQRRQSDKKLEELRSKITTSLPHELRTPLTNIIGFGEMLKNYAQMPEVDVLATVDQICSNAIRLQRLVENFLLYAQLEISLNNEERRVELRKGISEQIHEFIPETALAQAAKHQRSSDLDIDIEPAVISIARHHLGKIVEELVDNACKFSQDSSRISIKGSLLKEYQTEQSSSTKPYYQITINDNGRGMTPEQISNIGAYMQFERQTYEQQGPGLGLIIIKRLVELHEGSFTIFTPSDRGTSIMILLPADLV